MQFHFDWRNLCNISVSPGGWMALGKMELLNSWNWMRSSFSPGPSFYLDSYWCFQTFNSWNQNAWRCTDSSKSNSAHKYVLLDKIYIFPKDTFHLESSSYFENLFSFELFEHLRHLHQCKQCFVFRSSREIKFQTTTPGFILFLTVYIFMDYVFQRRCFEVTNKDA